MIENIRLSFQGIWAHKMRSFLTMLGIITVSYTHLDVYKRQYWKYRYPYGMGAEEP